MATYARPHRLDDTGAQLITTSATFIDTNYVDFGYIAAGAEPLITTLTDAEKASTAWFHMVYVSGYGGSLADTENFRTIDDGGQALISFQKVNGVGQFYYNVAGSWVAMGSTWTPTTNVQFTIDLEHVIHGSTGAFRVYINGTLHAEFTGNTEGSYPGRKVKTAKLWNSYSGDSSSSYYNYYSETVWGLGNSPTIGMRVFSKAVNGDGANTGWSGSYLDVDELGAQDGNLIEAASAGLRETFTFPDLPGGISTWAVQGVFYQARASGDGVRDMKFSARISGVDYDAAAAAGVQLAQQWFEYAVYKNPATSAVWTVTVVNAAEFGVLST